MCQEKYWELSHFRLYIWLKACFEPLSSAVLGAGIRTNTALCSTTAEFLIALQFHYSQNSNICSAATFHSGCIFSTFIQIWQCYDKPSNVTACPCPLETFWSSVFQSCLSPTLRDLLLCSLVSRGAFAPRCSQSC